MNIQERRAKAFHDLTHERDEAVKLIRRISDELKGIDYSDLSTAEKNVWDKLRVAGYASTTGGKL